MRRTIVVLALLLVACGGSSSPQSAARRTTVTPVHTVVASATPATICHANGPYPDTRCTPGAINPNVTQTSIKTTICLNGWTSTIRPPLAVTAPIKTERMKAYGIPAARRVDVELDHFIPLELGGATGDHPQDIANLWPEESQPVPGYHEKDVVENYLNSQVCNGNMALVTAQREIVSDWVAVYRNLQQPGTVVPAG